MHDPLTGLSHAQAARWTLDAWQTAAAGRGEVAPVHAAMIELGRLDTVNLSYGQGVGDDVLRTVAQRILHFVKDELEDSEWLVARIAGGRFLLAAHVRCSRERWTWLAEAMIEAITLPLCLPDMPQTLRLSPRIGLMRPISGEGAALIFDRLAECLAKLRDQSGRRIMWADGGLTIPGRRSAAVDTEFFAAMERGEIAVLFQPQVDLTTGNVTGAEALARWEHPELGRIGADQLFAIAERTDQVAQLSRHIADKALAEAARWPLDLRLSINVTPADLAAPGFAGELLKLADSRRFQRNRLTVEITEHVLLADLEATADQLRALRNAGLRIALDDFGAGFCNFRYLKLLPLDAIKLDRTMVDGIAGDKADLAVLRAIIAMARALSLQVIVEGVETSAQRDIVAREGAHIYQGYLCAKPMELDEFARFLGD
ncbi:MAG: GGDEF domain-containing phosphodiesterase [Pontixanthobacter sp.]